MTITSLMRESKILKIHESEVWKTLLKHRWNIAFLKTNSFCLNENQREDVIFKTAQDLKIHYDTNLWIPKEGLRFGIELFSTLHYCPEHLIEAAKLSKLFESLITNENLNTVVAATMHNIQPRAGDNIKDFTAINMWYQRLDERYNFSFGEAIFPLLTSHSQKHLGILGPPYTRDKTGQKMLHFENTSIFIGKKIGFKRALILRKPISIKLRNLCSIFNFPGNPICIP